MGLQFYELHENWRKILQDALSEAGIIGDNYTGSVELNFNDGGIVDCNKTQRLTKYSAEKNKRWPAATDSLPKK